MKKYKFWKENKLNQEYELTSEELKIKFNEWLKTKDKDWLEYYCNRIVIFFIADKNGLDSVTEYQQKIADILLKTKWKYLTSIGIK